MHPLLPPPVTHCTLVSLRSVCPHLCLPSYSSLNSSLPSSGGQMKMEFEDRYVQTQPKYDCLLFDLDDTLYPLSSGISAQILVNIHDYMVEELGVEKDKVDDLSDLLYRNYGTTLAGLRAIGYDFDYDEYHRFVHGRLSYEVLKPDPVLRSLLLSLPIRKLIFTNADRVHAIKALTRLGIEDCFEGMICFETLNRTDGRRPGAGGKKNKEDIFDIIGCLKPRDSSRASGGGASAPSLPATPVVCKPQVEAIEKALAIANLDPQRTIFFEDSVRNIQAGKSLGLHTVLVGKPQRPKGADYALESIHNLREAIPELWESADKRTDQVYPGKLTAMETSVTA